MDCPRCQLPLKRQMYEGVEVDFCETCWGSWLDVGELAAIIEARELHFSEDEKKEVLDLFRASRKGPRQPILCPRCGQFMEQTLYHENVDLLIDRCPKHGIWLDAGELKKMQVEAERSRLVQNRLIGKLKLQLAASQGKKASTTPSAPSPSKIPPPASGPRRK